MRPNLRQALTAATLAAAALWNANAFAADPAQTENAVQAADAKIEKCMADSRASYPDATAHDKRILTATHCICTQAPEVCNHSQMIQDFRLQQRVVEGK